MSLPERPFPLKAAYALRNVCFDTPALTLVLSGQKQVGAVTASAGQFIMIHAPSSLDVAHRPDGGARYRERVIAFKWELIIIARSLLEPSVPRGVDERPVTTGPCEELDEALSVLLALERKGSPHPADLDHRKVGVLLALARHGHRCFLHAADPALETRLRALVVAEPHRPWTAAHLARELDTSASTLRRRMREAKKTVRDLMQEARLHHALTLLQTGEHPLKEIATAAGYRALHRFREEFEERFGSDPADVMP
jgi:AraC-like DNA-binding protein